LNPSPGAMQLCSRGPTAKTLRFERKNGDAISSGSIGLVRPKGSGYPFLVRHRSRKLQREHNDKEVCRFSLSGRHLHDSQNRWVRLPQAILQEACQANDLTRGGCGLEIQPWSCRGPRYPVNPGPRRGHTGLTTQTSFGAIVYVVGPETFNLSNRVQISVALQAV
jgi:hypothetical protein